MSFPSMHAAPGVELRHIADLELHLCDVAATLTRMKSQYTCCVRALVHDLSTPRLKPISRAYSAKGVHKRLGCEGNKA
eukprot:2289122-Amphidinium_carterae.3